MKQKQAKMSWNGFYKNGVFPFDVLVMVLLYPGLYNANDMTSLTFSGSPNVQHGISATFVCNTKGNPPPMISWKLGEENIFQGINVEISPLPGNNNNVTNTLTFTPICADNGKNLTCTASQSTLTLGRAELLTVSLANNANNAQCALAAPSSVSISPPALNVNSGGSINISCVTPTSGVTFEWIRGGITISTNQLLFIPSVSTSDDGVYTCRVTNSAGSSSATIDINVLPSTSVTTTTSTPVVTLTSTTSPSTTTTSTPVVTSTSAGSTSVSTSSTVLPPQSVSISPSAINVTSGGSFTATCITSSSGVSYEWIYNNAVIGTSSTLFIQSASRFSDGLYTCKATNQGGYNSATIDINVWYAPVITTNLVNMEVLTGTTVTLNCENEANPPATSYIWTYNGTSETRTSSTFDVSISDTEMSVQCQAVNDIGLSDTTSFVIRPRTEDADTSLTGLVLESSLGSWEIAAISMGILFLLFLLLLLLCCCCCYGVCGCGRNREKQRVQPESIPEDREIYVINYPRFYEDPNWKTGEQNHQKKFIYHLFTNDGVKQGPIISIYDEKMETPRPYYLSQNLGW